MFSTNTSTSLAIETASQWLKRGGLVAIPTETVYGLAADARNEQALAKIYQAKNRPKTNPLIIHLSTPSAIEGYAQNIPKSAYNLAEHFWPGPLTLILERHPSLPKIVTANQESVALRIPKHPLTLELLKTFGGGLAAPSANRSGRISPTTASHVKEELGNKVDYILDGGPCEVGIESTILLLVQNKPLILRQGSITAEMIESVIKQTVLIREQLNSNRLSNISKLSSLSSLENIESPGSHLSHYAPELSLFLINAETLLINVRDILENKKEKVNVLSFQPKPSFFNEECGIWIEADKYSTQYARQLYAHLRQLDTHGTCCILVEAPPEKEKKGGEWSAIWDCLSRASTREF